jgi:hypothetical protein
MYVVHPDVFCVFLTLYWKVVVVSYQTLCQDFNVPKGTPPEEEPYWIEEHGSAHSSSNSGQNLTPSLYQRTTI